MTCNRAVAVLRGDAGVTGTVYFTQVFGSFATASISGPTFENFLENFHLTLVEQEE